MSTPSGPEMFEIVTTAAAKPASNPYRQASLDIVFGQVWTRPGLTRRERRWISLAAAGVSGSAIAAGTQIYGALNSGEITLAEWDEFQLQFAVYAGWSAAAEVDLAATRALERIAAERDEPLTRRVRPLRPEPLTQAADAGAHLRSELLQEAPATDRTPVEELLVDALEFGQVWSRGLLSTPERRLIALTCLAVRGHGALRDAHLAAALARQEFTVAALREVALHLGLMAGVGVGVSLDRAITAAARDSGRRGAQDLGDSRGVADRSQQR